MTNYSRKNAKIFGETANPIGTDPDIGPEIGQFGSAKAGTYNGTNDIDVIQSLPAWSNGWVDAVTPSQQFPTLPERTAVDHVQSYQIAYLLQKGVAEWDSATVYYTTSYCQHNGGIYRSKINDNIGNIPLANTSNDYWQFLGRDFLNTQQVTNCLLEVPNNIKLELENGVLTLKAGSKVIVPNGFEQDGVTPKFDEITIESDKTIIYTTVVNRLMLTYGAISDYCTLTPDVQCYSGATAPSPASGSARQTWYDTTNNIIKTRSGSSEWSTSISFPIAIVNCVASNTFTINQVFNGIGYIGSVIWADKGIKGLIPNGRNADGSLNNTEFTTSGVLTIDVSVASNGLFNCGLNGNSITRRTPHYCAYYPESNFVIDNGTVIDETVFGNFKVVSGVITVASFVNTLNINSMCDGQWVSVSVTLATDVANPTTSDVAFDISEYLPSDGFNYEIFLAASVVTGTTSGNAAVAAASSTLHSSVMQICSARTRTASSVIAGGAITLPVGSDRKIFMDENPANTGTMRVYLRGYRRLGTNF